MLNRIVALFTAALALSGCSSVVPEVRGTPRPSGLGMFEAQAEVGATGTQGAGLHDARTASYRFPAAEANSYGTFMVSKSYVATTSSFWLKM